MRHPANRGELVGALEEARKNRILDPDEHQMLEGVLDVSEMQVRDIMIPRSQMVVVERDASPKQMLDIIIESGHSRFPVIGEDRDEVIGILLAKDLLRFFAENEQDRFRIRECLRPAVFIPESKRLNVLLREFRHSHNHMAIVVDEYGGVAGLLTIEDVLEQIVGDIDDEHDLGDHPAGGRRRLAGRRADPDRRSQRRDRDHVQRRGLRHGRRADHARARPPAPPGRVPRRAGPAPDGPPGRPPTGPRGAAEAPAGQGGILTP